MKAIKLLMIMIFGIVNLLNAQNIDRFQQFEKAFFRYFKYPAQMQERCIPVLTLMVLSFDQSGKINLLKFSDSAYPQFIAEIERIKNDIDFDPLYREIKSLGKEKEKILIPIQIDTGILGECESHILQFDLSNLYLFDKKPLEGRYFLFKKLSSKILTSRAIS